MAAMLGTLLHQNRAAGRLRRDLDDEVLAQAFAGRLRDNRGDLVARRGA